MSLYLPSHSVRQLNSHPEYRPDVDGLRAVAILSVIGFHASPDFVTGGFIGVDVFFVISGYLISSIIIKSLKQSTFSFVDFYARRIRRIFPALAIVLATVWLMGWFILFTDEYQLLGKHIAAGASYLSNIVLWREAGYFDPVAELKPLLHLWSLGVEEQFYLVWPLLLVVFWKWPANRGAAILILAVASFAVNVSRVNAHPIATFYLPPSRFWELMIGSGLAYAQLLHAGIIQNFIAHIVIAKPRLNILAAAREASAALGCVLVIVAITCLDERKSFPGWWALLPTFGAALIIAAGSQAWINRRLLASRPMVFVGLISYPLYLWHWPLLSFAQIVYEQNVPPAARMVVVIAAFVLAWLTYEYVKKPIRSLRFSFRTPAMLFCVVGVLGVIGYLSFTLKIPPRFARYGLEQFITATTENAYPGPNLPSIGNTGFLRRQGNQQKTVLFLGDSNIEQYYPRIDEILSRNPSRAKSAAFATRGGCPPMPKVKENHHQDCSGLIEAAEDYAQDPNVDTVVIGANWASYFLSPDPRYSYYVEDGDFRGELMSKEGTEKAFAEFDSMVKSFTSIGKKVYIILQIPIGDAISPWHMIRRDLSNFDFRVEIRDIGKQQFEYRIRDIIARLKNIAKTDGAITIDPLDWLCGGKKCPGISSTGEVMYRDAGHLRPSWVRNNVHYLDQIVLQ